MLGCILCVCTRRPLSCTQGLLVDRAHAEVLTDGVAELAQRGVVNCAAKTFMHGKVVS